MKRIYYALRILIKGSKKVFDEEVSKRSRYLMNAVEKSKEDSERESQHRSAVRHETVKSLMRETDDLDPTEPKHIRTILEKADEIDRFVQSGEIPDSLYVTKEKAGSGEKKKGSNGKNS